MEIVHCARFFDDSIISILVLSLGRFFHGGAIFYGKYCNGDLNLIRYKYLVVLLYKY